jgi:hypothetical protein
LADWAAISGGINDGLQQLIAQRMVAEKHRAMLEDQQQQRALHARGLDLQAQGLTDAAADRDERRRRQAAADTQAAADRAAREAALASVVTDPTLPAATRRLITLGEHGINNLNVHALEPADEHTAHVTADQTAADTRDFALWKRQQDYSQQLQVDDERRRATAAREKLFPVDDPSLPLGSSRYITSLSAKQPGNYSAALQELTSYLNDPQTQRDHARLDPQKAVAALQRAYGGARQMGGAADEDPVTVLVREAMGGRGGRGSGPGPRATVPTPDARAVSAAELQALAQRRGTTLAQERARAAAAGYTVRD